MIKIGIICGSGLDDPDLLKNKKINEINTPYGNPSSTIASGKIDQVPVLVLARHGKKHQFSPTQVNNRANIHALKELGATHIIATTACGSLRTEIGRGDMVILDQFIDFTKHRINTFHDSFESGPVHTPMAEPFDSTIRKVLFQTAQKLDYQVHEKGTVVTIEGPRFSTRAESHMFRSFGADVINMSTAPEVALAVEAEIPYAAVAMSTDYDCWKDDEPPVSWEEILKVFNDNADRVKILIVQTLSALTAKLGQ
ncbi:S-methyl-5'-thioadenosine phosphorylase [Candidatus Magnetomorum sp. HK-1]|nr:S-methyl-5'-thioadenosine phosphorylase [Candidatus Magnetomorum sp. HK-1]